MGSSCILQLLNLVGIVRSVQCSVLLTPRSAELSSRKCQSVPSRQLDTTPFAEKLTQVILARASYGIFLVFSKFDEFDLVVPLADAQVQAYTTSR
ncbi:uncharacterized protein BDZ83DRAFT_607544 [Colletotrichum acutatum]|uniref:Secreted protein n=1 Tax=Glomerella acutata TaxID=27357 RepID=A0AAD8XKB3_GLOAC|nr:uncharacterized protein BDZ83DRAFT_607544 [Colletotrichum acutatum]KAK1728946.1 hypothetical protein BDZ83DRAFT_607544 [Colletotrichum acutatum]